MQVTDHMVAELIERKLETIIVSNIAYHLKEKVILLANRRIEILTKMGLKKRIKKN